MNAEKDNTFPRRVRVRKPADFTRAHNSPAFAADDVLVVKVCRNELPHARLGLSVSRRVGNAVIRNRWKRLIREAFRLSKANFPPGLDLVVRPRKEGSPSFDAICRSLPLLVERAARALDKSAGKQQ